jgi:programmed cell death protein 5
MSMTIEDDELTQLRQARQAELEQQMQSQLQAQAEADVEAETAEKELDTLNQMMRTILTPDARQRLARVELTRSDLATLVKQHLATLHTEKRISTPINDSTLKRILSGLSEKKRSPSIRRI